MARYVCDSCRPRPVAMRRRFDGVWICARCGDPLRRRAGVALPALTALVAAGLALSVLPPRRPWAHQLAERVGAAVPTHLLEHHEPLAALVGPSGLVGIDKLTLLRELGQADAAWTPRAERLPDGRTRYYYQRRAGEPQLSLAEIRWRIANPPSFEAEQAAIAELLAVLEAAGVRILITQPRKRGAAAEWDPRARTLRIKPKVLRAGSAEFAEVLNHEAIHVAQSCSRGGVRAMPRLLGLPRAVDPGKERLLETSVYSRASPAVKELEREAYANQHQLELGAALVRRHCRGAAAARTGS